VLPRAAPGRWDRGIALRVRVVGGALASVSAEEVLNGANLAAIGDGSPGGWELFQFTDAVLVGPGLYDLAGRLRGQLGTDGTMPAAWPVGSRFVLMNGLPRQIEVPLSARGLARHYRVGPALRSYDDPIYSHHVLAFDGIGLRPYAPCHLRAARAADGTLALSWIRRTRIDGDTWSSVEVPLGEEREAYLLRVTKDGAVLRAVDLDAPAWTYPAAQRAADGAAGAFGIEVAQVSDRFGPGPFGRIALDD
jgi:hypothetical protein